MKRCYLIETASFTAVLMVAGEIVTEAAPILRRLFLGKTMAHVTAYCGARGWKIVKIPKK